MAKNIVPSLRLGWYHSVNSTRYYSKWFHRRPVKVILPENLGKKGSRRAKLNIERQVSFVENFEKPDPFLLDDIIKEIGDPRLEIKKNTDVAVKHSNGTSTSGNGFEFDPQDKMYRHEAKVNSGTIENSVFISEKTYRPKMMENTERSIKPFKSPTRASIKKEKRVSSNDSFLDNVSSGEEKVLAESEEGQISDTNINKTDFVDDVDVNSGTTDISKSIADGIMKRSKGSRIIERPKTLLSKTDANDDFKEHFSDDSDSDSVSTDEESERVGTGERQLSDQCFGETVSETSTSGKLLKFTKLPDSDSRLSKFMIIAKSRKIRKKRELIVLEGKRLIEDFLKSGIMPLAIFFSRLDDIRMFDFGHNKVQLYKMTHKKLSLWSDLVTSSGVIGIFRTPNLADINHPRDALPVTVICDNVRDPGNMGSIIRIAAGVGCQQIIAPKGCVDIWETKVLRAAGGAHVRVPIRTDVEWSEVPNCFPYIHNIFVADSCTDTYSSDLCIPLLPYFGIDFSGISHFVLIIGGETGLSKEAMSLVQEGGTRLNVPLSNGVESLNTSIAFALILFEMKRQMTHWSQINTTEALKL